MEVVPYGGNNPYHPPKYVLVHNVNTSYLVQTFHWTNSKHCIINVEISNHSINDDSIVIIHEAFGYIFLCLLLTNCDNYFSMIINYTNIKTSLILINFIQ